MAVERSLAQIAPDEIALAVLHKVEDQFGYQRAALPRIVAELFGFDRLPPDCGEIVGAVVDDSWSAGYSASMGLT